MNKDSKKRCWWANTTREMQLYHDKEWNKLILNDKRFFEYFCLEILQAGLNWNMIINKRKKIKKLLDNFDFEKIKSYDENKIKQLLQEKEMIKNKIKIKSIIYNAKKFSEIKETIKQYYKQQDEKKIEKTKLKKETEAKDKKNTKEKIKSYFYIWLKQKIKEENYDDFNKVPLEVYIKIFKKNFKFVGKEIVREFLESSGIIKKEHDKECFMHKKN